MKLRSVLLLILTVAIILIIAFFQLFILNDVEMFIEEAEESMRLMNSVG